MSSIDPRPTWTLVLDAATQLTSRGQSPFKLSVLIEAVQRMDPARERGTIQPVVQGMTVNAGKGPLSPCGKVLRRVEHGYYTLCGDADVQPASSQPLAAPATRAGRRRTRTVGEVELRARIDAVIADFDRCVEHYDATTPFTRTQYELHRRTIDRRRELGSAQAAVSDERFTELLHATLGSWRIGRRASRLAPLAAFSARLVASAPRLEPLDAMAIESPSLDVDYAIRLVDQLITDLGVVDNRARIVAGTKTLHHLLPDLVPPMDRAWTGAFFGWSLLDPQNNQTAILAEALSAFAEIASAKQPSRLVGDGWRTSASKILDNALIGHCKLIGIGGTA